MSYVHKHDPILRWYRAVCGYDLGPDQIVHDDSKVTCPACKEWLEHLVYPTKAKRDSSRKPN